MSEIDYAQAGIPLTLTQSFADAFAADDKSVMMQNAITQTTIDDVAFNREVYQNTVHSFSTQVDTWEVTNQKRSGRCWMFAGMNLIRAGAMAKMNIKQFEFSQNYTFFWDKYERANYFLEVIIETAELPVDDRTVAWMLDHPLDDGGQWDMFLNIVNKYGLVPKSAMPESESSSNSGKMNFALHYQLCQGALKLRDAQAAGTDAAGLATLKESILADIYRILAIHLGTPPKEVEWQYKDKDGNFQRDEVMSPQAFAKKYCDLPINDYVCVVNDPRETSPYGKTFTVKYLGNMIGGRGVKYLNVPMDVLKDAVTKTLKDNIPVWMGCDVGKQMHRTVGLWDDNAFTLDKVYDAEFGMTKEQRLLYHRTLMTHAMLFTGVDEDASGHARRWRVENSWGNENGEKGYYVMNENWFDEYMFEIAVDKKYLPAEYQDAVSQEPIELAPWDPMGSLAR